MAQAGPGTTSGAGDPPNVLQTLFFGLLFYLCSADQFLAIRIQGFNFRLGQALLLACALLSLRRLAGGHEKRSGETRSLPIAAKAWLPFFLVYALAALSSDSPARSFLKLGWVLFNMGSAFLLCSNDRWAASLKRGVFWGVTAIALTIWVQTSAVYFFGVTTQETHHPSASQPLTLSGIHRIPLGFAQNTRDTFGGVPILRPSAFYYEPSYAGCALAFAFPLVLALSPVRSLLRPSLAPAVVLTAVAFTSSRSGILGLGLGLTLLLSTGFVAGRRDVLRRAFQAIALAVLLIAVALLLSPPLQEYAGFLKGPLGPSAVASRLGDPGLSEGGRVANMRESLRLWARRPLLGNGVTDSVDKNSQGLGLVSQNMWIEMGIEAGILGFLAFGFGLFKSVRDCVKNHPESTNTLPVLCALAVHFLVNMNFTSTFPRLDYWLLFFFALYAVIPAGARRDPEDSSRISQGS